MSLAICKLNDVDALGYLADVLTRVFNRHPSSQIDGLLPWTYIWALELRTWPENTAYDPHIPTSFRSARISTGVARQSSKTFQGPRQTGLWLGTGEASPRQHLKEPGMVMILHIARHKARADIAQIEMRKL